MPKPTFQYLERAFSEKYRGTRLSPELSANVTSINEKIDSTKAGLEEELRTGELRQELSKMQ